MFEIKDYPRNVYVIDTNVQIEELVTTSNKFIHEMFDGLVGKILLDWIYF